MALDSCPPPLPTRNYFFLFLVFPFIILAKQEKKMWNTFPSFFSSSTRTRNYQLLVSWRKIKTNSSNQSLKTSERSKDNLRFLWIFKNICFISLTKKKNSRQDCLFVQYKMSASSFIFKIFSFLIYKQQKGGKKWISKEEQQVKSAAGKYPSFVILLFWKWFVCFVAERASQLDLVSTEFKWRPLHVNLHYLQ